MTHMLSAESMSKIVHAACAAGGSIKDNAKSGGEPHHTGREEAVRVFASALDAYLAPIDPPVDSDEPRLPFAEPVA